MSSVLFWKKKERERDDFENHLTAVLMGFGRSLLWCHGGKRPKGVMFSLRGVVNKISDHQKPVRREVQCLGNTADKARKLFLRSVFLGKFVVVIRTLALSGWCWEG